MGGPLDSAHVWLEQGRPDRAEPELRRALGDDPDDGEVHALLALCLTDLDRAAEGVEAARTAIGCAPDSALPHLALAAALYNLGRLGEARRAVEESLRLDPQSADGWALIARIHVGGRAWTKAVETADRALAIEASHVGAMNVRAIALRSAGQTGAADAALGAALEREPENPETHTNLGWLALERKEVDAATRHFLEALRLAPGLEAARSGLVEALKAKNPLYRAMLGFFFWLGRMQKRSVWVFFIGFFLVSRLLRALARTNPALEPIVLPIAIALALFAYLTWIVEPLFDVSLLFHPTGRHALGAREKRAALVVAGALGGGIAGLVVGGLTHVPAALLAGLLLLILVIPIAATLGEESTRRRAILGAVTIVLALLAACGIVTFALGEQGAEPPVAAIVCLGLFGLGVLATGILANAWGMSQRRD